MQNRGYSINQSINLYFRHMAYYAVRLLNTKFGMGIFSGYVRGRGVT